jgi:hypothetical protein
MVADVTISYKSGRLGSSWRKKPSKKLKLVRPI